MVPQKVCTFARRFKRRRRSRIRGSIKDWSTWLPRLVDADLTSPSLGWNCGRVHVVSKYVICLFFNSSKKVEKSFSLPHSCPGRTCARLEFPLFLLFHLFCLLSSQNCFLIIRKRIRSQKHKTLKLAKVWNENSFRSTLSINFANDLSAICTRWPSWAMKLLYWKSTYRKTVKNPTFTCNQF